MWRIKAVVNVYWFFFFFQEVGHWLLIPVEARIYEQLKEVMQTVDLDEVTSKDIRKKVFSLQDLHYIKFYANSLYVHAEGMFA